MMSTAPSRYQDEHHVDAERPWPGLLSFGERDSEFFFGRDSEAEELTALVIAHRLTVVYGGSGLGKTSLLTAGVFPRLCAAGHLPVYVRFNIGASSSAAAQLKRTLFEEIRARTVQAPTSRLSESLWEYLHRIDAALWSDRHRLLTPVFVLDQFEEVFSRTSTATSRWRQETLEALGDLVEGRVSDVLRNALTSDPDLAARFNFTDHAYRIAIVIREDYLPDLDELTSLIPSLRLSRLRLTPMKGDTAVAAVLCAGRPADIVSRDVAESIVRFVAATADQRPRRPLQELLVEPALLSVVCRELNEERIRQRRKQIAAQQLERTESILTQFYEDAVADLPETARRFIEERMITADGVRDLVLQQTLLDGGMREEDVRALLERRLLRTEYREGRRLFELTHDRLAPIVRESRDRRRAREEEARKEAERTAELLRRQEALERAEEQRRRTLDQMRGMAAVIGALTSGAARDEVLGLILDSGIEVTGAERGFIMLTDENDALEIAVARGRGGLRAARIGATSREIPEAVYRSGRTQIFPDLLDAETARTHMETVSLGIRHVLCAPIQLTRSLDGENGRGALGVLYLDSRERGGSLSESSRTAIETLAMEATITIENARLLAEAREKARLDQELRVAASIQESLLPKARWESRFLEAIARTVPCRSIAGDFFNYIQFRHGVIGFILGDVAGKGTPAALLSATLQGLFMAQEGELSDPAGIIRRVNATLYRRHIESRFATVFLGAISSDGVLTYCNAGHNPPLVIRTTDVHRLDQAGGPIIGLFEHAQYDQATLQLHEGEVIVSFTDAVSEALSAAGEEFGEARVIDAVRPHVGDIEAALDQLLTAVGEFGRGAAVSDDATALLVRYTGPR